MYLWFDCETTGTDERRGLILEVALIITDNALNEVARYEAVIRQSSLTLDLTMNDWARDQHSKSGLTDLVLSSSLSTEQVERDLIALVEKHCPKNSKAILTGSTIHFDRRFLRSDMPEFERLLDTYTHRMMDVSAFKEAFDRHFCYKAPAAAIAHRALRDIENSIAEYKLYLSFVSLPAGYKRNF